MEHNSDNQNQHFLIVTYPAQGHINPGRHLARKIAHSTGARVTVSTAMSAHRKIFSSDEEFHDGLLYYAPYSDGYDEGFNKDVHDRSQYITDSILVGSKTLTALIHKFASEGRKVTCVIYALLMSWVAGVARESNIPCSLYWIQPATVFAVYYHYFHGYKDLIISKASDPTAEITLPHLPPLKIKDLPSFLTIVDKDDPYYSVIDYFVNTFTNLEKGLRIGEKPKILINSCYELESDAVKSVEEKVELISVGPVLSSSKVQGENKSKDLYTRDEETYVHWLDAKPAKSVIYISFGSMARMNKNQMEEISRALKETGHPYLWVVRKDNREELGTVVEELVSNTNGLVIEWGNQLEVLNHPSVGCFVTHCGWNSTLETVACGVPAIGMPQWSDQGTNASLLEKWGVGVRGEKNGEIIEGEELKRCLEIVMGEGERREKIREMAEFWKKRAREAVEIGGLSERNLRAFVEEMTCGNEI
ncbi:hypothetical protein LUZ60_009637 [Juncus effusus]|nr:hypothetical protein LUZ60_009637 [Juncus effusus]